MSLINMDGLVAVCGGRPGPPVDDETAERLLAEHPELGYCCPGAAMRDPIFGCTCWEPIYDLQQFPLRTDIEPATRSEQCVDCAYRHDSPEWNDERRENLQDWGTSERAVFWCHQGIRRPRVWRHPCGVEVPGDPANYQPPIAATVPYKANGTPADRCAGWAARQRLRPTRYLIAVRNVRGVHHLPDPDPQHPTWTLCGGFNLDLRETTEPGDTRLCGHCARRSAWSAEECPHGLGDPAFCSVCKHGPSPSPATEAVWRIVATFPSQYEDRCRVCNDSINVGDVIHKQIAEHPAWSAPHVRYVHERCA